MKTLQQALEEKILRADAKTVLDITDEWLVELRDQVSDDDLSGVEMVMWYLRTKIVKGKGRKTIEKSLLLNCEKEQVKP